MPVARVTRAHVEARTEDILAAAVRLFGCKGIEKTTMADIAAEAGLSAGAIYRYFPGKGALLDAVFQAALQANVETFAQASAEAPSPLAALFAVGEAVTGHESAADCGMWMEATLASIRDPESIAPRHSAVKKRIHALIEGILRDAQAAGEVDPALDVTALATLLFATSTGLQILVAETKEAGPAHDALAALWKLLAHTSSA